MWVLRSQLIDASELDDAIDLRKQIAEQLLAIREEQLENEAIELVSPNPDSVW
jgi:hypothetical protein